MTIFKDRMPAKRKGRGGARKGAGRPRKAKNRAKISYFSTRITQSTRDRLEAEARRQRGESLATVAEQLLKIGLAEKARRRKSKPLRALLYLIELLAENIPGNGYATDKKYAADPNYNWRTSPFMFMAFREAVNCLLASLQPSGQIVAPAPNPPPVISEEKGLSGYELASKVARENLHRARFPIFETPEKRGQQVAQNLLLALRNTYVTDQMVVEGIMTSTKDALATNIATEWYGQEVADAIVEGHYGLSDAIQDLKLQYSLSEQELTALKVDEQRRRQLDDLLEGLK